MRLQRIIAALKDRVRGVRTLLPPHVTIVGSYNTMNAGDKLLCDSIALFYRQQGFSVQIQSKRHISKVKSSQVIICGGDILHDSNENNWNFLQTATQLDGNVYFIGAGVPGFYLKSTQEITDLLSKFSCITTRDRLSFDRLSAYKLDNLHKSVDNAFLIGEGLRFRESKKENTVLLNIKTYESASNDSEWKRRKGAHSKKVSKQEYLDFWRNIIVFYKEKGCRIENVSMTWSDQVFIEKHFIQELDVSHPFTLDYKKIAQIISKASSVVSCRYHFLILALLNHKDIVAFAYADKVENILEDLGISTYLKRRQLSEVNDFLADTNNVISASMYRENVDRLIRNHYLNTNSLW